MNIGDRISELRKKKEWSQTHLGELVSVSREIIGRYERDDVMPSVENAKKIADAFDVSLDYLVGEGSMASYDKQTLQLMQDIEELDPAIKDKLLFLTNAIIRDAKTKKAYGNAS
jgi:transcriptional regulator with XRE-family HTH domain